MIKMIPLTCPKCGAQLDVKEGTKSCYCTYCGTKILINDENVKTVNIHQTITDEAKIKEIEARDKSDKRNTLYLFGLVVFLFVAYIVFYIISKF